MVGVEVLKYGTATESCSQEWGVFHSQAYQVWLRGDLPQEMGTAAWGWAQVSTFQHFTRIAGL